MSPTVTPNPTIAVNRIARIIDVDLHSKIGLFDSTGARALAGRLLVAADELEAID